MSESAYTGRFQSVKAWGQLLDSVLREKRLRTAVEQFIRTGFERAKLPIVRRV